MAKTGREQVQELLDIVENWEADKSVHQLHKILLEVRDSFPEAQKVEQP